MKKMKKSYLLWKRVSERIPAEREPNIPPIVVPPEAKEYWFDEESAPNLSARTVVYQERIPSRHHPKQTSTTHKMMKTWQNIKGI